MKNVLVIGLGILGTAIIKKLADIDGVNILKYDIRDGNIFDYGILKHTDLAVNCSEANYDELEKYCPVIHTDNFSTKNSVIIQNLIGALKNGDKVVISRPYDIDRRSYGQEKNIKAFYNIECEINIEKNILDKKVRYFLNGRLLKTYADEFDERNAFVDTIINKINELIVV